MTEDTFMALILGGFLLFYAFGLALIIYVGTRD